MCSCVSYVFGLLKTVWLKYSSLPRSLLPGKLWQKNRPNTVISVFVPSVFVSVFLPSVFSFCCALMDLLVHPEFLLLLLARNGSTSDPEPSSPTPRGAEHQPEPTDEGEPFPYAINEPVQSWSIERKIAPEVEPNMSNQVREPATLSITREQAVDGESAEWSSTHYTAA